MKHQRSRTHYIGQSNSEEVVEKPEYHFCYRKYNEKEEKSPIERKAFINKLRRAIIDLDNKELREKEIAKIEKLKRKGIIYGEEFTVNRNSVTARE